MSKTLIDWDKHKQYIIDSHGKIPQDEMLRVIGCSKSSLGIKVRAYGLNNTVNPSATTSTYEYKVKEYVISQRKQRRLLEQLKVGKTIKILGEEKVKQGQIKSLTDRFVVVRFANYTESFTLHDLVGRVKI